MRARRFSNLESARGLASIIVLLHHFCFAFVPTTKESIVDGGFRNTPLYILINGQGAVVFFFLLSGFVLTHGLYARPSFDAWLAAVLKRLPRLIVPAMASIVIGLLILRYSGAPYLGASSISGSDWLRTFGNAHAPASLDPSLSDALRQSLLVFLVPDHFYYNSNLWTMMNEFYGSLIVLALVSVFMIDRLGHRAPVCFAHVIAAVALAIYQSDLVPFVVGSWLAYIVATSKSEIRLSPGLLWPALIMAVVCFSTERWPFTLVGSSTVLLLLVVHDRPIPGLGGRVARLLGALSFPLYLVHTLVILSVSSETFEAMSKAGYASMTVLAVTLCVTVFGSLLACVPLHALDTVCVRWVNLLVKGAIARMRHLYHALDHRTAH